MLPAWLDRRIHPDRYWTQEELDAARVRAEELAAWFYENVEWPQSVIRREDTRTAASPQHDVPESQ